MTRKCERGRTREQFGRLALITTLVAATYGCANVAPSQTRPPSQALGSEYPAFQAQRVPQPEPELARPNEPLGELSLREALALSLLQSPELGAFSWETRAREAEALQAGLLPNPELAFEAENFAGSGSFNGYDSAETTVVLGQLIELGGKRAKRQRVAELERDLADWDYEVARLDVLTAATQAFVRVLEAERRLNLAEELRALAEESLGAVSKRVRAGAASSVEATRAEVNLSSAKVARRRADAVLATARARLASYWGARTASFERASGELDSVYPPPEFGALRARLENNPDVARWMAELAHREAVVELADTRRIPDVVLEGGVRQLNETNDAALVFGFSVPLPVFDRNQGGREAARHRKSKARSKALAATVAAARDLEVGLQALQSNYDAVIALRDEVLPQAENAFDGVRTGYHRGLFRYVDVLDAQRTLFQLRDRELSALGEFHRAAAEVERLTGTPIAPMATTPHTSGKN